jgi:putative tricarboxylic transport membrane protein
MTQQTSSSWLQTLVGAGIVLTGLGLGAGAVGIPSEAGYGGVGPNFLPWVVSVALTLCGAWIVWESRTGGFRELDPALNEQRGNWSAFVWVSAGLLANAALIQTIGFIFGCTLCYLLAVQGLRRASGQASAGSPKAWAIDAFTGIAISAPVYWMFTQFLAINLPGLTSTGWL